MRNITLVLYAALFCGILASNGRNIHPLMQFHEAKHETSKHPLGFNIVRNTYRSEAMPLNPGEVRFTDPHSTVLEFPKDDKYAITRFHAEVVDEAWNPVPLDEVYNHHWLVFNSKGNQGICGGYLSYIFGVGAESRLSPTETPPGYGYVTTGTERWTANIHLFRTVGPPFVNSSQALKECIECHYLPGKGCRPSESGKFPCCKDGSLCHPQVPRWNGDVKKYYLKYTIDYTTDLHLVKPIHMWLLDASGCKIDYNIEENNVDPVLVTQLSWKAPVNGKIIFSLGHLHSAGMNITLMVNGKPVCTSIPVYGTEVGKPGNEQGYIVEMPVCLHDSAVPGHEPFWVKVSDVITVRSYYWVGDNDPTGSGLPGGFHGGVMSYFYIGAEVESVTDAQGHPIEDLTQVVWEPDITLV